MWRHNWAFIGSHTVVAPPRQQQWLRAFRPGDVTTNTTHVAILPTLFQGYMIISYSHSLQHSIYIWAATKHIQKMLLCLRLVSILWNELHLVCNHELRILLPRDQPLNKKKSTNFAEIWWVYVVHELKTNFFVYFLYPGLIF